MPFPALRLAALALCVLLAGCTISSEELLVSDTELAFPLPQSFALTPYMRDAEAGGFKPDRKEAPRPFTLRDGAYWSDEGSLALRFVARPAGGFLLAASNPEGEHLYGRAVVEGDVMVLQMMIDNDAELAAIIAAADAANTPGVADLAHTDGGLVPATREALDLTIGWLEDGTLVARPLVTFVGADATTTPPNRIRDVDGAWRTE